MTRMRVLGIVDIEDVKKPMRMLREDDTSPDMRLFDDPMAMNSASVTSLIRLMGGGPHDGSGSHTEHVWRIFASYGVRNEGRACTI